MSNLDMSEAIRLLAQEKGMSEDDLLHVLVDALASAYKRRPGAADEVVVEVNPEPPVPDYESWWDVPVAEVSTSERVRAARLAYEGNLARERSFV